MKLLLYLLILQLLFKPGDCSAFECSCDVGIIQENAEDLKSNLTVLKIQIETMQTKMDRLESKLTSVLVAVESLAGKKNDSLCETPTGKRNDSLCPNSTDWIFFEGSCYLFPPDKLSFLNAEEYCKSRGGHVVHMDNEEENSFIRDHLKSLEGFAWIGLTDIDSEGKWILSGTDNKASYTNWADGEPNNYNYDEDCVFMAVKVVGLWYDAHCSMVFRFVCEI